MVDTSDTTTRGDTDQRRHDVLRAASDLLRERSGDGFSMREVAERAGVSAGAVYQWFSGKAEILSVLHTEQFERVIARMEGLPIDLGFEATVGEVVREMAVIWQETGHHRTTIINAHNGSDHDTFLDGITVTFLTLSEVIERRLREAAAREGHTLRPQAEMMPWLWAVCMGAGTQLIDVRFIGPGGAESYLSVLTAPTAAGLVAGDASDAS